MRAATSAFMFCGPPLRQAPTLATPAVFFPPDWIERTSAKVPGVRVEVIADAGHSPYFEQPERWNAVVGDFLQRAS